MDINNALKIFDSLSQETRLNALRLLVKSGASGMPAGKLSEKLDIPQNTMSFHLNHLTHAGIISAKREGRSIIYSVNFNTMTDLIGFMIEDCCSEEHASLETNSDKTCHTITLSKCCTKG